MRIKNVLNVLLLCGLTAGALSTVVSCKDYDDDISALQTKQTELSKALIETKSALETKIADLKTQLEAKDAELAGLITKLQNEKADKTELQNVKSALEAEIVRATAAEAGLEARIQAAEQAITNINALLDTKVDKEVFNQAVTDIYAKISAVETSLTNNLNQVKADLEAADAAQNTLIAQLQQGLADEEIARKAVAAELELTKTALNNLTTRVDALELSRATKEELATAVSGLETKISDVKAIADDNKVEIGKVKESIQNLSNDIDEKLGTLKTLTLFVENELRSLVFVPESYYYGIEAAPVIYLRYSRYETLPAAAYDKEDKVGYTVDHETYAASRLKSNPKSKVQEFVAYYHLNPCTIKKENLTNVDVISHVKNYIGTRGGNPVTDDNNQVTVTSWHIEDDGDLVVNLNVDEKLVQEVSLTHNTAGEPDLTGKVLIFAVEATYKNAEGKNVHVTSDYATMYKDETVEDGVKIAYIDKNAHTTNKPNVQDCAQHTAPNRHLYQVWQEAVDNEPQAFVKYDETLDLTTLVETHLVKPAACNKMTDAVWTAGGYYYKFNLVGLYKNATNEKTSESAHAAIKDNILQPVKPTIEGKQGTFGSEPSRQTIGRTPVVRVELYNGEDELIDYGYIRIAITDKDPIIDEPVVKPDVKVTYEMTPVVVKGTYAGCNVLTYKANGSNYKNTWAQTEYDLYSLVDLTREEFEKVYNQAADGSGFAHPETDADGIKQYVLQDNGKFRAATAAERLGELYSYNGTITENGTPTNIVEWKITAAQALAAFKDKGAGKTGRAMRFISHDPYNYPDIFVYFTVEYSNEKADWDTTAAAGTLTWSNKLQEYWYASNTSNAGDAEIHSNVYAKEDMKEAQANTFKTYLQDVFQVGKLKGSEILKGIEVTAVKDYALANGAKDKLAYQLSFKSVANKMTFKDQNGTSRTLTISADGKKLMCGTETVAELKADAGYEAQLNKMNYTTFNNTTFDRVYVEFQNKTIADQLLNAFAHNALCDDAITAHVGIKAVDACDKEITMDGYFDVRFLRPINLFSDNAVIEDASVEGLQQIKIKDLVYFTDWRDAWNGLHQGEEGFTGKGGDYEYYYGITSYSVPGLTDGDLLSSANVTTSIHLVGGQVIDNVQLSTMTQTLDMKYNEIGGEGVLTYKNLGANVQEFTLKFNVSVKYIWGTVVAPVQVTVKRTHNNVKVQ